MNKQDKSVIIGLNLLVFILAWAYLIMPESTPNNRQIIYPFYLWQSHTPISKQAYADYAFFRFGIILLVWIMCRYLPAIREEMVYFLCFWCGYLFEYFMVFNQPYTWLWKFIPISFSLFIGIGMIIIFGRTLFVKS